MNVGDLFDPNYLLEPLLLAGSNKDQSDHKSAANISKSVHITSRRRKLGPRFSPWPSLDFGHDFVEILANQVYNFPCYLKTIISTLCSPNHCVMKPGKLPLYTFHNMESEHLPVLEILKVRYHFLYFRKCSLSAFH